MRLLRVLRAVLWSFFGVRRGADAARDLEGAGAGTILAIGVAVALLLVLAIVLVVRAVVGGPPAAQRPSQTAEALQGQLERHGPVRLAGTMEERMRPCASCHGSATQATRDGFSPRIAGKPAGYLFNQLASFRDGRRTYPPMVYLVQYMGDDYLREIAGYFAKLELPYPPPEAPILTPSQAKRAQDIVEHGDDAHDVPACVQCHGAHLSGTDPAIPGLLGLPRQYISEQFGAWRAGRLRSAPPDCMAEVAQRLAAGDVALLAAWLAAQPIPAVVKPERGDRKLPLECGSVAELRDRSSAAPRWPAQNGRGAYLVAAGDCVACHTDIGGAPFAGGRPIATPFGTVYSSNITPDASGIGAWSRDDFWRALHEGRSKDARLLYPAFPYPNFTRVTREDADAMFDYLRTLPAVSRKNRPHALRFPYSTQAALAAWRLLFFRSGTFEPEAGKSAEWNRGAYLVRGLGHCDACHASRNIFGAVSHSLDLGGGLIPMQKWYAPPLGSRASVAGWPTEEIVALLASGISRHAMAMGPMAEVVYRSTQHLSPADARAIAVYLQQESSDRAANARAANPNFRALARGASIYQEQCAECHGDNGEGAFPAYPALAGNPSMNVPLGANAIKAVLNGGYAPVTAGNPRPYGMPPFFGKLSDEDIAAVLTYARDSWGNAGAPVSALDVERYR
jgi:cytochrome c553